MGDAVMDGLSTALPGMKEARTEYNDVTQRQIIALQSERNLACNFVVEIYCVTRPK